MAARASIPQRGRRTGGAPNKQCLRPALSAFYPKDACIQRFHLLIIPETSPGIRFVDCSNFPRLVCSLKLKEPHPAIIRVALPTAIAGAILEMAPPPIPKRLGLAWILRARGLALFPWHFVHHEKAQVEFN